jgi:hypothetical protein
MGGYAPEGLLESAGKIMERCNQQGMRLPYILCFISPNGSILAARVSLDQPNPIILAESVGTGGFRLPMTVVVVDQTNQSIRATIVADGKITYH